MPILIHFRAVRHLPLILIFVLMGFSSHLTSGQEGIASKYPEDEGIENDPEVFFVEKFSAGSLEEILVNWENVQHQEILSLSSDVPESSGDQTSLLMSHVGGKGTGAHLYRQLKPGYEQVYVRFYVKFDQDCFPIHHFFHVGGYQPATEWPQGGAGVRPHGDKRFSVGIEPYGKAWVWDYYAYWMEMGGSPPHGQTWGNSFICDEGLKVVRDRWICMELMIKMNDVGDTNGEMALWVDGRNMSRLGKGFPRGKWIFDKFIPNAGGKGVRWDDEQPGPVQLEFPENGEPFGGFRWRNDEKLKLNFLWVLLYITEASDGHLSKVWFDNIVVATQYIGPVQPGEK